MSRFSEVVYNAESSTVEVGAGLIWDEVYRELEQYGVNVVGGRVSGVGVAGFTLGGGVFDGRVASMCLFRLTFPKAIHFSQINMDWLSIL